jgi:hypothetical protein
MKTFALFTESLNGEALADREGLMQYFFQEIAKKKDLKKAAAVVAKNHGGGQNNWALGGHVPPFSADTLIDAYYVYRSKEVKKLIANGADREFALRRVSFPNYLDAAKLATYL